MKKGWGVVLVLLILGVAIGFYSKRAPTPPPAPVEEAETPAADATATPESDAPPSETPRPATPTPKPKRILPKSAAHLNEVDQDKFVLLIQILESKNDNDPRLDRAFAKMSPEFKRAVRGYYREVPAEKRNDRGTLVFLIGRDINEKADVEFLKNVLMEKPCLSLSDCSKSDTPSGKEQAHLDGINETTANYPQLMAIRQMTAASRAIRGDEHADQSLNTGVINALKEAEHSPNQQVADQAAQAVHFLTGHN